MKKVFGRRDSKEILAVLIAGAALLWGAACLGQDRSVDKKIIIAKGVSSFKFTEDSPYSSPTPKNGKHWYEKGYDVSKWREGVSPFGYGCKGKIKYGTKLSKNGGNYFFVKYFDIEDPGKILSVELKIASDNAAIVYINGLEIDKDPLFGEGGGHNFSYWNRKLKFEPSFFKKGKNIIAVNLYNNYSSSDACFDMEMEVFLKR
jgi:hypothetical protein